MRGFRFDCWLCALVVALAGCASETTQCDGVFSGGECYPCPGKMVGGICITGGEEDVKQIVCKHDLQCLPVAVCIDGYCGQECTQDKECAGLGKCKTYRCVWDEGDVISDAAAPVPCRQHIECDPLQMACIDGFCGRECTQDWHCEGPSQACIGYRCQGTEVEPEVKEEVVVLPPDCDPVAGGYGAACDCKQECATALCVQNKLTNVATCTQFCQNDAQCPGSDICLGVDNTQVCILNDAGQETSCDPAQAFCYKGIFLTNKVGKCACTVPCTKASDCPENHGCHLIGLDKVCALTGQACSTAYNPCFGECAGNPRAGAGFCTVICLTSADCPEGWTCQSIGGGISVCASPY